MSEPESPSRPRSSSNAKDVFRRASVSFMEAPMTSFFGTSTTAIAQAPMTINQLQELDEAPPVMVRRRSSAGVGTPMTPTISNTTPSRKRTGYFEGEAPVAEGFEPSSSSGAAGAARGSHSIEQPREPTIAEADDSDGLQQAKNIGKTEEETIRRDSLDDYEPEPPELTKGQAVVKGLKAYGRFLLTLKGFLITLYFLNVVAWGAMIFLLLITAANSEMCPPPYWSKHCSDKNSPKSKWIEIDSQILNAFFCVTGFGLLPWRLRDLIFLMQYRIQHKRSGLDKLATVHKSWFRIDNHGPRPDDYVVPKERAGDENIESGNGHDLTAIPTNSSFHPAHRITRTGEIAPVSRYWLMDLVVWFNVSNSVFQCGLAGVMWGLTRFTRPSATTAIFIVFAFGCGIGVGVITLLETNRIKKIEGRALKRKVIVVEDTDVEQGKVVGEKAKTPFFRRHF